MTRFLRRLRRAWSIACRPVPLPSSPTPAWTDDDARALSFFLRSPEGLKLGRVLRDSIARECSAAMFARPDGLAWAAGHAAGMQALAAKLDALAVPAAPPAGTDDDRPSDSLDWLHSTPDRNHG